MNDKGLLLARSRLGRLKLRVEAQRLRDSLRWAGRFAVFANLAVTAIAYARRRR